MDDEGDEAEVEGYFHGLCLDCMSVTNALQEGRSPEHEYWLSDRLKEMSFELSNLPW